MVTLLTAAMIQGNDDVRCRGIGPFRHNGKYAGEVNLYKEGEFHCQLLSTEYVYATKSAAKAAMEKIVSKIRDTNLKEVMQERKG